MLRELTIDGFRGLEHFEIKKLGRVNLLVGENNSGKTSVLEAIQVLTMSPSRSIWQTLSRRGENLIVEDSEQRSRREVDICRLFHGHVIETGSMFRIEGVRDSTRGSLTATIQETPPDGDPQLGLLDEEEDYAGPLELSLKGEGFLTVDETCPISSRGGLSTETLRRMPSTSNSATTATRFLGAASMSSTEVVSLVEDTVLEPEEKLVIQALKTVEPAIDRIATVSTQSRFFRGFPGERGGVFVKCAGVDQRIPIGSLGDGIWRILGLALALVHAENGVLLIDEIDTGLHYTVMSDMWKLVSKTAKRLNVQVFATTHSRDAVDSLAAISRADVGEKSDVTIQRLERDKRHAVSYNEQEIIVAAERGTEVR